MALAMELVEENQRLFVRVTGSGPDQVMACLMVASGTAKHPLTGWERHLGRMVEQAGLMFELAQMVAAFGGNYNDVADRCRLLGGVWQEAYQDGGRSAVHNLMTHLANQVLNRVNAGGA